MAVRILWVRPGDTSMSPGDELSEEEVVARGHLVQDLIDRGEAEFVGQRPQPKPDRTARKPAEA